RDFFDRTNEAFCSAEMNELWETRPNDKVITDCLTNIGKAVLDLRELFTGERAVYKDERLDIEGLSSETSHSIRYWMTEAIGRDVTEFDRFVRTLPRIAQAAVQGREQIEAEKRKKFGTGEGSEGRGPESTEARGRPKDHFKVAFMVQMLPVWEE